MILIDSLHHSSRRTDAIHSLGMAGIADLQEVKKWIGMQCNVPHECSTLQQSVCELSMQCV